MGVSVNDISCSISNGGYYTGYINNYAYAVNNKLSKAKYNITLKPGSTFQGATYAGKNNAVITYDPATGKLTSGSALKFQRDFSGYRYTKQSVLPKGRNPRQATTVLMMDGVNDDVYYERTTAQNEKYTTLIPAGQEIDVSLSAMLGSWMKENGITYVTTPSSFPDLKIHGQSIGDSRLGFVYDADTGKAVLAEGMNLNIDMYIDTKTGDIYAYKPVGIDVEQISGSIVGGSTVANIDSIGQITFTGANIEVENFAGTAKVYGGTPSEPQENSNIIMPGAGTHFEGEADFHVVTDEGDKVIYDDNEYYSIDINSTGVYFGCVIGTEGTVVGLSVDAVNAQNSVLTNGSHYETVIDGIVRKGNVTSGGMINTPLGWTTGYQNSDGQWVAGYDVNGKTGTFTWETDLSDYFIKTFYPDFSYKNDSIDFSGIEVKGNILDGASLADGYLAKTGQKYVEVVANEDTTVNGSFGTSNITAGTVLQVSTARHERKDELMGCTEVINVLHNAYGGTENSSGTSTVTYSTSDGRTITEQLTNNDIGIEISALAALGRELDGASFGVSGTHTTADYSEDGLTLTDLTDVQCVVTTIDGHAWVTAAEEFGISFDNGNGAQNYIVEKGAVLYVAIDDDNSSISIIDGTVRLESVNYGHNDKTGDKPQEEQNTSNEKK